MKKFFCITFFFGLYFGVVFSDQTCGNATRRKIEEYTNSVPSTDLIVCSDKTRVKYGDDYAPALLEKTPTMYFDVENACKMVTVIFFGNYSEEDQYATNLLWVVYNVPASDLKKGFNGTSGKEQLSYKMPKVSSTPKDHFFFVYCQASEMDTFHCCSFQQQTNINLKDFSEENSLQSVIAALSFHVTAADQLMDKEPEIDGKCSAKE